MCVGHCCVAHTTVSCASHFLARSLPVPLAALEAAHTSLQQRLGEAVLELDAARVAKGQAEVDFEVGKGAGWCAG